MPEPIPRLDLRAAVERFDELLRSDSKEIDFQRLFSDCPYILSRSLPLRLEPSEIVPLGRPGRSEPDFAIFPDQGSLNSYGIIELKRPDSQILTQPRKGVLTLTRDAQTAISQSEVYGRTMQPDIVENSHLLMLGNRQFIFVIMGLSQELANALGSQLFADQLAGLLPPNCQLIPYDTLFKSFQSTVQPQLMVLVPDSVVRAHIDTSAGAIVLELHDEDAPKTVENFRKLSAEGFYDQLVFHRVIPDFMIQGGCPEGTGRGGPGYTFEDEINDHKIVRGALAMANAGPNTNGSQFFIVTTSAAPWLDGKHTVFGEVIDGMDVVDAIESTPTDGSDKPVEPQAIERVELDES